MNICLVGINQCMEPVAIREKVAVRSGKPDDVLQLLRSRISHGVILSTCNRTVRQLPALTDEQRYSLEMMTRAIVAKILKDPIHSLKANGHNNHDYAAMVEELFQLHEEKSR